MPILARRGIPLLVHAEWDSEDPAPSAMGAHRYADYLASRPAVWETRAIGKMLALCAEFGGTLHIVHLSATEALPMLSEARAKGLPVTVETAPHYLYFDAETIPDGDTRFKCAPPIRSAANRDRLWDALRAGTIDLIATDHSPCPPPMKGLEAGDFGASWGGIAGLQTGLSAVWTEAEARGFGLADVARWMATAPAHSVGLEGRKGVIAPGADADFVVFDPEATFVVSADDLHYRHKITPYEGRRLQGVVRQTYLRGACIFEAGEFPVAPSGHLLARGQNT
jgi:allantoinase